MKLFHNQNDGTAPKYEAEPTLFRYDSRHYVMPLRTIIKIWLVNKLILGKNGAELLVQKQREFDEQKRKEHEAEHSNPTPQGISANHIAIILDGKVMETLRANDQLADILLSEPDFVKFSPEIDNARIGHVYKDGSFKTPDQAKDI